MQTNIATLETVYAKIKELNRQNDLLRHKYGGDAKYARIHKRLMENAALYGDKLKVFNALSGVKTDADQKCWIWSRFWTTKITLKTNARHRIKTL